MCRKSCMHIGWAAQPLSAVNGKVCSRDGCKNVTD